MERRRSGEGAGSDTLGRGSCWPSVSSAAELRLRSKPHIWSHPSSRSHMAPRDKSREWMSRGSGCVAESETDCRWPIAIVHSPCSAAAEASVATGDAISSSFPHLSSPSPTPGVLSLTLLSHSPFTWHASPLQHGRGAHSDDRWLLHLAIRSSPQLTTRPPPRIPSRLSSFLTASSSPLHSLSPCAPP